MDNNIYQSVFDMTDEEIQDRAKPIAEAARKKAWDHGQPISYRNELCTQDDHIIHEYKNGEKILVSVSPEDGNVKKIKSLYSINLFM